MAEFNFFGTLNDTLEILKRIKQLDDFKFVANKRYKEPNPLYFEDFTIETLEKIYQNYDLFLWSNSYSQFPPSFDTPNGIGEMRIQVFDSGPMIELYFPSQLKQDGMIYLRSGHIMYQPLYINPTDNSRYKTPEPLKSMFNKIKSLIIKLSVKRYIPIEIFSIKIVEWLSCSEPIWIGPDAYYLLENSLAEILRGQDTKIKGAELLKNRVKPMIHEY